MLPIIAIFIGLLIAAVLLIAAGKPNTFRIERAIRIQAPPEKIFPLINDFHQWNIWSPWEKLDPALRRSFNGPASGTGSLYAWEGNKKVGAGSMEILESMSPEKLKVKLDFIRPFEGHNTAEFTLNRQGDATDVNWAMYGPNAFISKLMQVFFSIDQMIGKDFESGLANIKTAAEK